ncbi:MAG: calcium/proton exchanger [Bryobacteraceae bacterium]
MQWKPSLDWLLIFVPVTVAVEWLAPQVHAWIFASACLAILPLAAWLGHATEHLAAHTGEGVGGLLNATFGNAAEVIIAVAALQRGLHDVVKASLTGSIIGNILLVAGLSMLAGGLRYRTQSFQPVAARAQATLLILSAIALVVPAVFHHVGGVSQRVENDLSLEISFVLLAIYAAHLVFSLITHRSFFTGLQPAAETGSGGHAVWSRGKSAAVLAGSTALIAWMSEILVGSVEQAAHAWGMSQVFIGVIVVAVIGNAAEHSSAILMAWKNRMDLSLSIAVGSSIQVALFVAPVLVLLSYWIGPAPMNLVFTAAEVLAVVVTAVTAAQIASDGESNWLEGAMLLAVYLILAMAFYFLPEQGAVSR